MRRATGLLLAVVVGCVTGCGANDTEPQQQAKAPAKEAPPQPPPTQPTQPSVTKSDSPANTVPPPVVTPTPPSVAPPAPPAIDVQPPPMPPPVVPPMPPATLEANPAAYVIPDTPAAGTLNGQPFKPDVQIQGDQLRLRVIGSNGAPNREISLAFAPEPGKTLEGRTFVVRQDQEAGTAAVGVLITEGEKPRVVEKGFALKLELGRREKGKLTGKIALKLPEPNGGTLLGTFAAEWVRGRDEPPGPDDAPYITGKVIVTGGPAEPTVGIGYVRVDPFDAGTLPILDMLGIAFKPGGFTGVSEESRPRVLVIVPPGETGQPPGRYEILRPEPGRYCVLATVKDGPAAHAWVTVTPGGQVTADFTINVGVVGSLQVTPPAGAEEILVVPAGETGKPWPELLVTPTASMLGLAAKLDPAKKDATVTFERLAPGKYEVYTSKKTTLPERLGAVEVKPNEKATVAPAK